MLTDHLDESSCIQKLADYEGKKFVSIEKVHVKMDETKFAKEFTRLTLPVARMPTHLVWTGAAVFLHRVPWVSTEIPMLNASEMVTDFTTEIPSRTWSTSRTDVESLCPPFWPLWGPLSSGPSFLRIAAAVGVGSGG